jgi:hypothetical protein
MIVDVRKKEEIEGFKFGDKTVDAANIANLVMPSSWSKCLDMISTPDCYVRIRHIDIDNLILALKEYKKKFVVKEE